MQQSLDDWISGLDGLDYIHGPATLRSDPAGERHQVTVGDQVHTAPEVYLNVGARASQPHIAGLDSVTRDDRGRAARTERATRPT